MDKLYYIIIDDCQYGTEKELKALSYTEQQIKAQEGFETKEEAIEALRNSLRSSINSSYRILRVFQAALKNLK